MRIRLTVVLVALTTAAGAASAWHGPGHNRISRQAVASLPDDVPKFFRDGGDTIAHLSVDPDNWTRPVATTQLDAADRPEHYFDVEQVADLAARLPANRYKYLEALYTRGMKAEDAGMLPYAVSEWTQRLSVALAEHRRWPDDPAIRTKCLVYAGILAHYSADLCQPLHTTIHYDGKTVPGQPRKKGIHLKLDAAIAKLPNDERSFPSPRLSASRDRAKDVAAPYDDLMAAVAAELGRSHALVDRVYELEDDLPAYEAPLDPKSKSVEFLRERLAASSQFTARLFATAWQDSANITFPEWYQRPPVRPDEGTSRPAGE
jgi:hypothetical protein